MSQSHVVRQEDGPAEGGKDSGVEGVVCKTVNKVKSPAKPSPAL